MEPKYKGGAILKKIRIKAGMNQKEFGEVLGVQQGYVSKLEKGRKDYSFTTFIDLCSRLSIDPKDLF